MQFHNTKAGLKQEFKPLDANHVKIYVCGPTVYDDIHIGNARPLVVFDVLYRLLQLYYPQVTYIRNITDIDDKICARARTKNIDIAELTQGTAENFQKTTKELNCLAPTVEPRATAHIFEMISLIEKLLANGSAYQKDGHVLFSMADFPEKFALVKIDNEKLIDGARVDVAPYKRDPRDFILWKPSGGDCEIQEGWDSPFGFGRPGWHIECSAMAKKYLGTDFDIHGGGQDLIFPHHFNECAQSLCADPESGFARYWLHNGYVLSHGEKMSKSKGNFYTVSELLEEYDGEVLRLGLLMTHYRQPFDFSFERMNEAKNILDKFYEALGDTRNEMLPSIESADILHDKQLIAALADDLNTPLAIARLHEMVKEINTLLDSEKKPKQVIFYYSASLLGLLERRQKEWTQSAPQIDDVEILDLIHAREHAKTAKNYAEADRIRDILNRKGIILEDTAKGTAWKRKR